MLKPSLVTWVHSAGVYVEVRVNIRNRDGVNLTGNAS